jgi:hypothetical protein
MRTAFGMASTSGRMVAPVVVKPEHISKKLSKYEGMDPSMIIGIAPIAGTIIQLAATIR